MLQDLLSILRRARVYDLAHAYAPGIPHHPVHPPFIFGLTKAHGESERPGAVSSAADSIAFGGHVGTHIDALCHFSKEGLLHGGVPYAGCQSYGGGVTHLSIDTVAPILRRGVLLDIAGHLGVPVLPADRAIGAALLEQAAENQGVRIAAGDVVLIRTGWSTYWPNPKTYINDVRGPGINEEGARWLSGKSIFAAGSDTIAFEFVPSHMPVHVHFLVECGIHIIEALDLEGLAADHVSEFLFAAAPLKIQGGTGSPLRPVAIAP